MPGLEGLWLGKYHLIRRIGGGGMGDVYLAEQPELRQQVAVKVLHGMDSTASQEEQRQAIHQLIIEAKAISTLKHPNIISIYDFGEQSSILYLVMEYLPFGSLADFLAYAPIQGYRLPLPPPLVADLINQVAGALQFAHDHQFVHLDVKPQNLLLKIHPLPVPPAGPPPQGGARPDSVPAGEVPVQFQVILADFGLARFISATSVPSGANGTPLYTAPEQYQRHRIPAIDQYALAGVAYLLLTGEPIFKGTLPELYHQHMSVVPRPATDVNPHVPPAVNGVLARALAKNPAQRFPHIQDFAQALMQAVGGPAFWPVYSLPTTLFGMAAGAVQPATPAAQYQPSSPPVQATLPPQPSPGKPNPAASPSLLPPGGNQGIGSMSQPPTSLILPAPSGWTPPPQQPDITWEDAPTLISSQPLTSGNEGAAPAGAGGFTVPPRPIVEPGAYYTPPRGALPGAAHYREPDAPPAPLPPGAQKLANPRRAFFEQMPPWQRALFGGLALVLLVGSAAGLFLVLRPSSNGTKQIQITKQTLTKFENPQSIASLPALTSPPQAEAQIPARLRTASQPAAPHANSNLPVIPINTSARDATSNYPANLPTPKKGDPTKGLNQQQLGIGPPVDVSIASNGTTTVEVVDGGLLLITPSTSKSVSLADLFKQPLGQSAGVLGEPRILFDEGLGAWIIVSNQFSLASDGSVNKSVFDIAISESPDPTNNWDIYQISTSLAAYTGCTWADNPQIGSNALSIFITGTSFDCGPKGTLRGANLWVLPKITLSDFQSTETIYAATGFTAGQGNPVVTLTPAIEGLQEKTEWLISNDAGYVEGGQVSTELMVWAVAPGNQSDKAAQPVIFKSSVTLPYAYADPPLAPQLGVGFPITTGDARVTQVQLVGGHLYGAFTTAINWEKDPTTRSAIYWFDLLANLTGSADPARSTIKVSLFQAGLLGDPDTYFFYPLLVVDVFGNAVLFGEATGAKLHLHTILTSRLPNDPLGAMGGGANNFIFLPVDSNAFNGPHWGDYLGGCAVPPVAGSKKATIVVAGPHVTSFTDQWQTDIWEIPTKGA